MFFPKIFKTHSRRGVTLLEMLLVSLIGVLVVTMATSIFIFGSKMAVATTSQNRFDEMARARVENLKNTVRSGKQFRVLQSGNLLEIDNYNGTVASYRFRDADLNPATLKDNSLFFKPTGAAEEVKVISFINRSSGLPIFSHSGGSSPLQVTLRIGDAPAAPNPYVTGPYTQAVDVVTTISKRNAS